VRAVVVIALTELRRFLRDKSNIFFVFILPVVLVLVIGSQFGAGSTAGRVTVTGEPSNLRTALVEDLEKRNLLVTFAGRDDTLTLLARGRTHVGVFVTQEAAASFDEGEAVSLELVTGSASMSMVVDQYVRSAVDSLQLERAQLASLTSRGITPSDASGALHAAHDRMTPPTHTVTVVGEVAREFVGLGQFDLGGASQVMTFTFLTTLSASASLIQARRNGVIARTLAAPVSTTTAIAGQALGRWVIAITQGAYVMAATSLLFGVEWGNLGLALLIVALLGAVAAGAAMVLGSVMDHEGAASGVGVGLGLVLASLGGSMVPLEFLPDAVRTVSRVTPHAWAYEAFAKIQRHDAGLIGILPELGVLAGMAALTLVIGSWTLRRSLARGM